MKNTKIFNLAKKLEGIQKIGSEHTEKLHENTVISQEKEEIPKLKVLKTEGATRSRKIEKKENNKVGGENTGKPHKPEKEEIRCNGRCMPILPIPT